ncbi:hypothetical protein CNYM01_12828 [Colletotrichum nymphaeae SA-01]|uniref:F-box domain-containing protein n=1 Tax=Colletotrichum nymphaeae SA-01 TaxID=1460502 RepID=A0A135TAK4_9PEZI|nr:hypothetical protein CNYM01_12828 [Colletotrichum nymphaeae SA-01]
MTTSQSGLFSTGSSSVIVFVATSPLEICALVLSHLDNCDLKALRSTCNKLANLVRLHLRFKRAFISASPLNVQVFRAIANDDIFRRDVREIIWDDARYETPPPSDPRMRHLYEDLYDSEDEGDGNDGDDRPEKPPRGVPFWYFRHCKDNIEYLEIRRDKDSGTLPQHLETAKQLQAQLPLDVAYTHYQKLLAEQNNVLSTSADVAALEWVLENDRFPNIKRITLTPAAHGILFHPLYPTPAIRALPYGFNYPLPRGWPVPPKDGDKAMYGDWESEDYKECWRGFRHVVRILAHQKSIKTKELIIDGNQIWSGLPCSIFYAPEPCVEYDNLAAVIKKPGFTTLRLSLIVGGQETNNYLAFRNGRLRKALEADLRHFSLETGEDDDLENGNYPSHWVRDHFIPLRSVFPVETWKNLAHFGLTRWLVRQLDLLEFLAALPQTLRSVELSFLSFMKGHGNYRDLLFAIRDTLGWQERTASARPRMLIRDFPSVPLAGRAVWVEDALQRFLYEDGENPYPIPPQNAVVTGQTITWGPGILTVGHGFGMEKDALEPRFERPYESADKLIEMGISRNWKGAS